MLSWIILSLIGIGHAEDLQPILIDAAGNVSDASGAITPRVYQSEKEPISVDLVEADIRYVLRLFAEVSEFNFVMGDDVQGTITVHLEEVPWDLALAAILQSKGLGLVSAEGEVFMIHSLSGGN